MRELGSCYKKRDLIRKVRRWRLSNTRRKSRIIMRMRSLMLNRSLSKT